MCHSLFDNGIFNQAVQFALLAEVSSTIQKYANIYFAA